MAAKMTSEEKKIRAAVRLLEKHGYTITPPAEPVVIDVTELNKKKMEPRKQTFIDSMRPFIGKYSNVMLNEFYLYWTEPNKTFTKMRFEMQKTWDLALRLNTWYRNNQRRGNGRKQITDNDRAEKLADILLG
jgi:hypothetical protein